MSAIEPLDVDKLAAWSNLQDAAQQEEKSTLSAQLAQLTIFIQTISIETSQGNHLEDAFNILDCLSRPHLESFHSSFITYMLRQASATGEPVYLSLLLKQFKQANFIPWEESCATSIKITQEHPIGFKNEESDIYGRIDLFLEHPDFNIAIENKIFAGEQDTQVERYARYCKSLRKPHRVFYLTPEGVLSSQNGREDYIAISYRHHILPWLTDCLRCSEPGSFAFAGISNYCALLEKKIILTKSKYTMELIEYLLHDENKVLIKYLEDIAATITPLRNRLRNQFFLKVYQSLKSYRFTPVRFPSIKIRPENIYDAQYCGFILEQPSLVYSLDDNFDICFAIEHDWHSLYFGLVVIKKNAMPTAAFDLSKYKNANEIIDYVRTKSSLVIKSFEDNWISWVHFNPWGQPEKFGSDTLNYEFAVNIDELCRLFVNDVMGYIELWQSFISSQLQAIKVD